MTPSIQAFATRESLFAHVRNTYPTGEMVASVGPDGVAFQPCTTPEAAIAIMRQLLHEQRGFYYFVNGKIASPVAALVAPESPVAQLLAYLREEQRRAKASDAPPSAPRAALYGAILHLTLAAVDRDAPRYREGDAAILASVDWQHLAYLLDAATKQLRDPFAR